MYEDLLLMSIFFFFFGRGKKEVSPPARCRALFSLSCLNLSMAEIQL